MTNQGGFHEFLYDSKDFTKKRAFPAAVQAYGKGKQTILAENIKNCRMTQIYVSTAVLNKTENIIPLHPFWTG